MCHRGADEVLAGVVGGGPTFGAALDAAELVMRGASGSAGDELYIEDARGRRMRRWTWDPSTNAEGSTIGWVYS